MALKEVWLWDPVPGKTIALPDIKYIGSAPALPITVELQTEEAVMSDKSRRLAFFDGPQSGAWREFTLGWGYLDKTQLDQLTALVALKKILKYENEFEDATVYDVYVVSFSYEFVRTGIRDLKRFRADMLLREV